VTVRQAYDPRQKALGVFVQGLPDKVFIPPPKSLIPDLSVPEHTMGYHQPWRERIDPMVDVITKMRGDKILVCPLCKRDVEPSELPKPNPCEGELIFENKKELVPNFCYCSACKTEFFIHELVVQRSFRMKLASDVQTYVYATAGTAVNLMVDGFEEEHIFF